VPDGAKVTLQCDKKEYFLGENVLVHFILENISDKPFEADFGGDYRKNIFLTSLSTVCKK
jgi:hypothetical protein